MADLMIMVSLFGSMTGMGVYLVRTSPNNPRYVARVHARRMAR